MKKILILAVVVLIGAIVAYKMYNKPHTDMAKAKSVAALSAEELFQTYSEDESAANEQYLGRIIEVSGEIKSVAYADERVASIALETEDLLTGINCFLDEINYNHRQDYEAGQMVTMKCVCTGILMDIELNRCIELTNK